MAVSFDQTTKKYYSVFKYRDADGKLKWKKKRGFARKKDALNWERDESRRIAEEVAKKKSSLPTFREVSEMMLSDSASITSTLTGKRQMYARCFSEYLDVPIDRITKPDLIAWRNKQKALPLMTRTINQRISHVAEVFRFAAKVYDIPNPATILKNLPRTAEELNAEMQVWSVEEFNQFLPKVSLPLYGLFFEFIFWTGCRRGEAMALYKSDVSPDGYVTISKSYDETFGESSTKNKKSRTIKLDSTLYEHIKPLLDEPGKYLFGGEIHLSESRIRRELIKGIAASGVKPIRLHDFRHSHVSILYDHGVSTKAIAERIGDTELQVLKTYNHLMSKQADRMNSIIEELHKSG